MLRNLLWLCLVAVPYFVCAQGTYPRNQKEDREGIMSEAYWKLWSPSVQAQIDKDIETYRKADGSLSLPDAAPGTTVKVEQISHEFIFGAHIFNFNQLGSKQRNDRYKELYGTLFNSATIAFYWRTFETEEGRLRFREEIRDTEEWWNHQTDPKNQPHWRRPATDPVVDFCKQKGIRLHGHTLVWGNRKWQNPMWIIQGLTDKQERSSLEGLIKEYGNLENYKDSETYTDEYDQLSATDLEQRLPVFTERINALFTKRITEIADYYKGKLDSWDVVNESATDFGKGLLVPGSKLTKSTYGLMPGDYVFNAFQTAEQSFPEGVKLNINDYNLSDDYVGEIRDLQKRGAKVDIMGSQMHLFNPQQCLDVAAGKDIQTPALVRQWYDRLSQVGLPIHLSEITITAPVDDSRGRQIQAVIARNLYRLWFSLPKMMGITWWNVVDDCGAPGEPSVSGLFLRDMTPKPAYYALNDLINNEWKTSLSAKVQKDGTLSWRGFKGRYRISYEDRQGNIRTTEYDLR